MNRAFLWNGSRVEDLNSFSVAYDLNDKNQIVGFSGEAFLWENNEVTGLGTLGGPSRIVSSIATGINNKTQIVGVSITPSEEWHIFLWENGTMIDLGIKSDDSFEYSINDNGQILGEVRTESGDDHIVLIEIDKN